MNEIGAFVGNVGFPIAVVFFMGYKLITPIFERFLKTLDVITETNKTLVDTNSVLADNLDKKIDKVLMEVTK